jgi:hypothetical protein
MFSTLFKKKTLIDDESRQWLFDTFSWAVTHFNVKVFSQESILVLPNNQCFPGSVSSVHEMALNMFNHTVKYAGMESWPLRLVPPEQASAQELPLLNVLTDIRGKNAQIELLSSSDFIDLSYHPSQVNQPQDLIAIFVQQLATLLVRQQAILPPGGKQFLPQAVDVLAAVMGFGLIFTNTAYQFKGGCGSCNNRSLNRQSALPENEMLYSLALFCYLKNSTKKTVISLLKPHLRSDFKKMLKEIPPYLERSSELSLLTEK